MEKSYPLQKNDEKNNRIQKIEKNFIIVYLGKGASYLGTDAS